MARNRESASSTVSTIGSRYGVNLSSSSEYIPAFRVLVITYGPGPRGEPVQGLDRLRVPLDRFVLGTGFFMVRFGLGPRGARGVLHLQVLFCGKPVQNFLDCLGGGK